MNLNATLAGNVLAAGVLIQLATRVPAQPLLGFDFMRAETAREWGDPHHISALRPSPAGLEITERLSLRRRACPHAGGASGFRSGSRGGGGGAASRARAVGPLRGGRCRPLSRRAEGDGLLVNGFTNAPAVKVNGVVASNEFHAAEGRLMLKLAGESRVEIER